MATQDRINRPENFNRFIIMQHREGVSVTMNVRPGEDAESLMEAYRAIVRMTADINGYAFNPPLEEGAPEPEATARRPGYGMRRKARRRT